MRGFIARTRFGVVATLVLLACESGCRNSDFDPASFVIGLRVLAVSAQPPEVAAGQTTTISALTVDTLGHVISVTWDACTMPPLPGDAINTNCAATDAGTSLVPLGDGQSFSFTAPMLNPLLLGLPDASGGLYIPLIADATAGTDEVTASYRLRYNIGSTPNQNPVLSDIFKVLAADAGEIAVDAGTTLVVRSGDQITLSATFADGSAESYLDALGKMQTETLSVSWYTTAGEFSADQTGPDSPDTILKLDKHLPASITTPGTNGPMIDVWAVGHDERGGSSFLHRALQFE